MSVEVDTDAVPGVMLKLVLWPVAKLPLRAVSVYVPALSTWHPLNVATPFTAGILLAAQYRVAPPGEVSSTETLSVDDVMFEAASWIMTAGCPDQYASDCADVGWTLKAS